MATVGSGPLGSGGGGGATTVAEGIGGGGGRVAGAEGVAAISVAVGSAVVANVGSAVGGAVAGGVADAVGDGMAALVVAGAVGAKMGSVREARPLEQAVSPSRISVAPRHEVVRHAGIIAFIVVQVAPSGILAAQSEPAIGWKCREKGGLDIVGVMVARWSAKPE